MNRTQRVVLIVYCVLLAYCCVWVPWHVEMHISQDLSRPTSVRMGYGWLWAGPSDSDVQRPASATLDLPIIGLRFLAVTAIAGAAFFAGGWATFTWQV
jgi:glucose dehydrogenase